MNNPIFIVGRFRSGTSFLWQIFEQLEGFCTWYEPLHPELLTAINHVPAKTDHVGVNDYWKNYRDHPTFADYYAIEFATRQLYLEPQDEFTALLRYIKHLIALSGDQTAVLQFNRADLRLPWLRHHFPHATIIHIERNPLQLYYSQRKHINKAHRDDLLHWDAYELLPWCCALSETFPMLMNPKHEHAFYGFYWIYKLSHILAKQTRSVGIHLETDVFESDAYLHKIRSVVDLTAQQVEVIKTIKHIPDTPVFSVETVEKMSRMMTEIDLEMSAAGLLENLGKHKLEAIRFHHADYWQSTQSGMVDEDMLRNTWLAAQQEVERIKSENKALLESLPGNQMSQESMEIHTQHYHSRTLTPSQQESQSSPINQYLLKINGTHNDMAKALAENRLLKSQSNQQE